MARPYRCRKTIIEGAMDHPNRNLTRALAIAVGWAMALCLAASAQASEPELKFEIAFPAAVHSQPVTGRVFVVITDRSEWEPRVQASSWTDPPPLFGADINYLKPGDAAVIDSTALGYPVSSLHEIPAGDYHVQAILNIYTE